MLGQPRRPGLSTAGFFAPRPGEQTVLACLNCGVGSGLCVLHHGCLQLPGSMSLLPAQVALSPFVTVSLCLDPVIWTVASSLPSPPSLPLPLPPLSREHLKTFLCSARPQLLKTIPGDPLNPSESQGFDPKAALCCSEDVN